jgi:type IV secretory pathway VirB2 component (pilin)
MDDHRQPTSPKGGFDIGLTCGLLGVFLSAANFMTSKFAELDAGLGTRSGDPLVQQIADLLSGNIVKSLAVLLIVAGGLLYSFGVGYIELGVRSDQTTARPKQAASLPMNIDARMAEARIAGLLARLKAVPEELREEATIELEGIEQRHMPALTQAHREARATVSPTSKQADELDADYAASLDRLSATLAQMVNRSEALGRERLQWQTLVIEERFPNAGHEKDQA